MNIVKIVILVAFLTAPHYGLAQVSYSGKQVQEIHGGYDSWDCTSFVLTGVTVADPAVNSTRYFSVPKAHIAYKETVAMLFSALLSGRPIAVGTTGGTACNGMAAVRYVVLQ